MKEIDFDPNYLTPIICSACQACRAGCAVKAACLIGVQPVRLADGAGRGRRRLPARGSGARGSGKKSTSTPIILLGRGQPELSPIIVSHRRGAVHDFDSDYFLNLIQSLSDGP